MKLNSVIACILTLLVSGNTYSQSCNSEMDATAPTASFIDNRDGTVTHKTTGLTWARCPIGQTWNSATGCTGEATPQNWQKAMESSNASTLAGKKWRLPNAKELFTTIEHACWDPAVNLEIFPSISASANYWTSSYSAALKHTVLTVNYGTAMYKQIGHSNSLSTYTLLVSDE